MARKKKSEEETSDKSAPGRPIWTGSISFGLVNVPVSLFSMEKRDQEVSFRMIDSRNNARVRYERVNEKSGEPVPWEKIAKAYEYEPENYVILEKEELDNLALESLKTIEVQSFVDRSAVDIMFYEKPYIVVPKKKTEKGYVLLRDVMTKTDKVGIAKITIRTREYLAALVPRGDALVVMILRFAQELRGIEEYPLPSDKPETYNINDREVQLAEQLVAAMSSEWNPGEFHDEYRAALMAFIEAKVSKDGLTTIAATEEDDTERESANVVDLAALLSDSLPGSAKEG